MALCPGAHFGQVCPGGLIRPPARLRAWPACISQGRCYVWERDFFFKRKTTFWTPSLRESNESQGSSSQPSCARAHPQGNLRDLACRDLWLSGISERPETRCALAEALEHLSLPPVGGPERRRAGPRAPKPAPFTPPARPGRMSPPPHPQQQPPFRKRFLQQKRVF